MSENVANRRLAQVAVEFNISRSTLVDFLNSEGIAIENKPNSKLTEEAYNALLKKFQPDKRTKEKSDQLKLTPLIHKEEKLAEPAAKPVEHEIPVKTEIKPAPQPVTEKEPEKPKEPAPKEVAPVQEKPEPKPEKPVSKPTPEPKKPAPVVAEEPETQQLKVVGKIDLDSLKPKKKGSKKAEAPAEKAAESKPAKKGKKEAGEEQPVSPVAEEIVPEEHEIFAIAAEIAEELNLPAGEDKKGLTIVGKIDLEQFRPKKKPLASTDDLNTIKKKRRKRKRINSGEEKIEDNRQRPGGGTPGGGGGGGQFQRPQRPQMPQQGRPGQPPMDAAARKEMEEKRIQEEIKKTLNRLTQKTGFSETKSKLKKKKREEKKQRQFEDENVVESNVLQVTEFITANELANLMNVQVTQVIMTCMNLGLMVSINQRLDAETITVVADEFGYEVEFREAEMDEPNLEEVDSPKNMVDRAPIVTIMGHVDHGKTSLLDYIRRSNIIAGEAGGITQHIGAYEVSLDNGKKITFLDTPGHEAFTAMRARGAKVTDIVIVVIAADDTVMPQTREAISHAQAAGAPIVFAFNKIDKEGANVQRIKEQLAEMNLLVEDWGGKYQSQEISAKKGLNIDALLEKVLLEAELLELKADPKKRAIGTVIEASLDRGKGIMASIVVEKGTLRVGDPILAGANFGKVKAMFNERGQKVDIAGPATPVQVLGFDGAPTAGDKFYVTESEQSGKELANKRRQLLREQGIRTRKHITLDEIGRRLAIGSFKELNLIIKGDVDGSVEALSDSLQRLSTEEVQVNVIFKSVGQISESDVLLASASDAIIIGFQVRPSPSARKLAEQEQIDIRLYSVIYDAIEEVKAAMEGLLAPTHEEKIVCNVEVRDVFKITKVGTIAGCYVTDGKITRNTKIRLIRDGVVVFTGELDSLKRFKDDVKEVASGYECGIGIKNFNDIKEGDIIEGYEEIEVARKL
jgi:translation initiation factor IF-2